VHVRGELAATGYAVEIEDRGIGMDEAELADANHRLTHPPEFDLADSDRLGLFIVGRLAERRGIEVRVTASPYGGTRAFALIPLDFIAGDGGSDDDQTWSEEPAVETGWQSAPPWRSPGAGLRSSGVAGAIGTGDGTDADAPELPQRVRQASLAPQLRADTPAPGPVGAALPTTRPPQETRSLMASLQQGWIRGREEDDPDE
jgi:hypothetical protein